MEDKRVYPRIGSQWPIYVVRDHQRKQVGRILNISLTGICIELEGSDVDSTDYSTTITLKNESVWPPELVVHGTRRWKSAEEGTIVIGLELDDIESDTREALIHYLSRNDALSVDCLLA